MKYILLALSFMSGFVAASIATFFNGAEAFVLLFSFTAILIGFGALMVIIYGPRGISS